jgi:hypothetical protein
MKTLIASSLLALSFSSFACPDLSGNYMTCTSTDDFAPEYMIISNDLKTKTYTVTDKYDGEEESTTNMTVGVVTTESSEDGTTTYTVSCNGNTLVMNGTVTSPDFSGVITGTMTKSNGILTMNTSVDFGGGMQISNTTTCR